MFDDDPTVELPSTVRAGRAENHPQRPLSRGHGADAADDHTETRFLHPVRGPRKEDRAARQSHTVRLSDDVSDHEQLFVPAGVRRPGGELQARRLVGDWTSFSADVVRLAEGVGTNGTR